MGDPTTLLQGLASIAEAALMAAAVAQRHMGAHASAAVQELERLTGAAEKDTAESMGVSGELSAALQKERERIAALQVNITLCAHFPCILSWLYLIKPSAGLSLVLHLHCSDLYRISHLDML